MRLPSIPLQETAPPPPPQPPALEDMEALEAPPLEGLEAKQAGVRANHESVRNICMVESPDAETPGAHANRTPLVVEVLVEAAETRTAGVGDIPMVVGKPVWVNMREAPLEDGIAPAATRAAPAASGGVSKSDAAAVSRILPSARLGFVLKVYSILFVTLFVTFAAAVPFMPSLASAPFVPPSLEHGEAYDYVDGNGLILGFGIFFVITLFWNHWCMMAAGFGCCCCCCCCDRGIYRKMMMTAPFNYLYLFSVAGLYGAWWGWFMASHEAEPVSLTFGVTAAMVLALLLYAVMRRGDNFTGYGGYVLVILSGLSCLIVILICFPGSNSAYPAYHKVMACIVAIVFGCIIVFHTHQILGTADEMCRDYPWIFHPPGTEFEHTASMHVYAALNIYMTVLACLNPYILVLRLPPDEEGGKEEPPPPAAKHAEDNLEA